MNRDFIALGIYSVLSVVVINSAMNWMGHQTSLHSEDAFQKAEQTALQTCRAQHVNHCAPRLVNAQAPQKTGLHWQFQFRQAGLKSFTVEVQESGKTRVL